MRERNQQARAVHKAQIHGENAVVPHVHATEVLYPSDRALDFPAFAVAPQLAFVFVLPQHAIAAVGAIRSSRDDGVAAASGRCRSPDPRPRDVVGCADARDRHGHTDRSPGRLGPAMFRRLGRSPIYAQRGAVPLYDQNQLHPFSAQGLADCFAPILACRNVASRKASSQSRCPRWSSWRSSCRQAALLRKCLGRGRTYL